MRISLSLTVINREEYREELYKVFGGATERSESRINFLFDLKEETDRVFPTPGKSSFELKEEIKSEDINPTCCDGKKNIQATMNSFKAPGTVFELKSRSDISVRGNSAPKTRPAVSDSLLLSEKADCSYVLDNIATYNKAAENYNGTETDFESGRMPFDNLRYSGRLLRFGDVDPMSRLRIFGKKWEYNYKTVLKLLKEYLCISSMRNDDISDRRCGLMFGRVFRSSKGVCLLS